MQDYYEINVSLNGQHFFATAERSCVSADKAEKVYNALRQAFPVAGGYEVNVTQWRAEGRKVLSF